MLARHARRVNTLTARPPAEPIRGAYHAAPTAFQNVSVGKDRAIEVPCKNPLQAVAGSGLVS